MEIREILSESVINYGYIAIFIIVMLEYANVPLPSELVLPLVGIVSINGDVSLTISILISSIGGICGSII